MRHVLGGTITVALDVDLAGIAPVFRGRLQPVGQIGSLVRIPQGLVDLIASVSLVGIAELTASLAPTESVQRDERWLQVQLLGEIDRGTNKFHRGIGTYPGLDDPVHFATADELASVFPRPDDSHVRIGRLAAAEEVPVCIDAAKFVLRHAAVVGSTGSGKTSAVSSLLQNLVRGGWRGAHVVVIDPHGEYSRALADSAAVRSVLAEGDSRLRVPYWALPAAEISKTFAGLTGGASFNSRFAELVMQARREYAKTAKWLALDEASITADTPVPFDIRPIWYQLAYENRETRQKKGDPKTVCETDKGDAQILRPPQFQPYNPGSQQPDKAPLYDVYGTLPELLRLGLLDPRLRFLQEPKAEPSESDPLITVMQEWLGLDRPISVLDFSGVPANAADLAIGVVLNLLFEVALRAEQGGSGIGRPSPILIVLEEAHRYLSASANALTRDSANRIAREGRKYGVGMLLVSQRPTELPTTALAQCGTFVALRLSNSEDQGAIRAALPDTVSGLAAVLPSLRTGEAVVSGEAVVLPCRALLDLPDPRPLAEDPPLTPWRNDPRVPDLAPAIGAWRGTYKGEA
ncbi:MAG TPA: ATP-binding protein [Thermoanaerobaculia bacterium]|nr:ATP-binding protein [Thermoanaerobaculia bacterium]